MNVKEAIELRRAYRSLEPIEVSDELLRVLYHSASLAPTCFNNQPTRFVFVRAKDALEKVKSALYPGNAWAKSASLIVAVFSRAQDACLVEEREYYLYDAGTETAFLILRATELGLVAHPIAGYNEAKVKEALGIPPEYRVITLVIIGKKSETINPVLSEKQIEAEKARPVRKPFEESAFIDRFQGKA